MLNQPSHEIAMASVLRQGRKRSAEDAFATATPTAPSASELAKAMASFRTLAEHPEEPLGIFLGETYGKNLGKNGDFHDLSLFNERNLGRENW